jgi:hypothetical protein
MHARGWLALSCLGLLCWQAQAPSAAWESTLEFSGADSRPLVLFCARADRTLSAASAQAVDAAWEQLRPNARRVRVQQLDPLAGRPSSLALCVFAPDAELIARRDGPMDATEAREWLARALDAAATREQRALRARDDPQAAFDNADLALSLGDTAAAAARFAQLAASANTRLAAQAQERLARLALERGAVAVAREHLAAACDEQATPRQAARLVFTRGLLALAQREHRAACADLRAAAEAFEACADPEADAARLALARAQIAQGEPAGALLTLDALAQQASCATFRGSARALAEQLRTPSGPTAH